MKLSPGSTDRDEKNIFPFRKREMLFTLLTFPLGCTRDIEQ